MKKLMLSLILIFSNIPNAYASDITIINNSTYTINAGELINLSQTYKKLVLKAWKVSDMPLTIYLVDSWDKGVLNYLDNSSMGYHAYNENGPYIVINMKNADFLTLILTHELAETLVDPYIDRYVYYKGKKIYVEICDPTNDRFYIGSNLVSDFAFPAFYRLKGKAPYSYTRSLKKPFITSSGFIWTN